MFTYDYAEFNKVKYLLNHFNPTRIDINMNNLSKEEIIDCIIYNSINIVPSIANHNNFIILQDRVFSLIMRAFFLNHIEIKLKCKPTYFGFTREDIIWSFTVSQNNTDKSPLLTEEDIWRQGQEKINKEKLFFDYLEHNKVEQQRLFPIFSQKDLVYDIYTQLKYYIPYLENHYVIALASIILFDIEFLSSNMKPVFFSCQKTFSSNNAFDSWISCLDIQIDFETHNLNVNEKNVFH